MSMPIFVKIRTKNVRTERVNKQTSARARSASINPIK